MIEQHAKDNLLELRFNAKANRLCMIRPLVKKVAEEMGCDQLTAEQVVIAINEACMNVIQHAYCEQDSGEIVLEIHNNKDHILFRITDFAKPIDLSNVKPRDLDDIRPGGLGTFFIQQIMDKCTMGHLEGKQGNYLELVKHIEAKH